jgi:hypothetical protein
MNPPRRILDPRFAVATWADRKIPEFIGIFATVETCAEFIKDYE